MTRQEAEIKVLKGHLAHVRDELAVMKQEHARERASIQLTIQDLKDGIKEKEAQR